ncbi:MAG TPA: ammonium transporter [Acidimicrobiales bacterium]|nr:ammonium transporter [Acidimicrobiales bacterium]
MSLKRKLLLGSSLAAALVMIAAPAFAQDEAPTVESVDSGIKLLGTQVNLLWVVIGAVLVIFMQAGFALVETGFCRAKHAAHVVSTNFAVFGLGFVGFFLIGYALMFGGYSLPLVGLDAAPGKDLIGSGHWVFLWQGGWALTDLNGPAGAGLAGFFLYMVAFMDTTATIPTGAMAERWQWRNFVLWGLFCGAIYYPIFGAWTWGGGWLAQLGNSAHLGVGYVDFAGSGVVHAMGGMAGLAGSYVLGARIGKFDKDGKPRALLGHHIPMAMLGTFILLFGWFGFNAASTFAATDTNFAVVAANTAIAASFGATVAMLFVMFKSGKPDPGMMANGMLAGLVAITAPCAFVDPYAAAILGGIAGILVVLSISFVENKLKIDDPVGAISVHGTCGIWGVLCVGLFANGKYGAGWNATVEGKGAELSGVTGIFHNFGDGIGQLGAQAIGALVLVTVMLGIAFLWFKLSNLITPIRSKEEDELVGLDLPEMGVLAYPEFTGHGGFTASS